jgi:hypothetical protein
MHDNSPVKQSQAHQDCTPSRTLGSACLANCEALAARFPLAFALFVTAALFATTFAVLSPSFQTNDDPQIEMIASGRGMGLAPDEHLIFTNVIIGRLLKSLYLMSPSIPWYGGYLLAVQYLAQATLLYCTLAGGFTRWRLAAYLLLFATVGIFYLNNLQFTTTACLIGQSGAVACLLALRRAATAADRSVCGQLAVGIALLVVSSLVRLDAFYLTALVALPAALCLMGWPWRREVVRVALVGGGVCVALVILLAAYNNAYYARDSRWQAFLTYNKLRIKFNDYGWTRYTPETATIFASVGWTENDHAMIQDWFYDDPEMYSAEKLQRILESRAWMTERLTVDYFRTCVLAVLRDKSLWPMVLVLPLALWGATRSKQNCLALAGTLAAGLALVAAVAIFNKTPPSRVYFPALTFPLALLLLICGDGVKWPHRRWPALAVRCFFSPFAWHRRAARALLRPTLVHAILIMASVGIGIAANRQWRVSAKNQALRGELYQFLADLQPRHDQLFILWPTDFPLQALSPFDSLTSLDDLHLLLIGWPQGTPISMAMKRKFAIHSPVRALHERRDVCLLGDSTSHTLLREFARQHCGVEMDFLAARNGGHAFDLAGRFEPRADYETTAESAEAKTALRR